MSRKQGTKPLQGENVMKKIDEYMQTIATANTAEQTKLSRGEKSESEPEQTPVVSLVIIAASLQS